MYGTGGIQNPMAQILRQQDSLKLTGPQADSLATMNRSIGAPATLVPARRPMAMAAANVRRMSRICPI